MKTLTLALAAALCTSAGAPTAHAADDPQLQRLALCQDSWFEWKGDEARMERFAGQIKGRFTRGPQGDAFEPNAPTKMLGYSVSQVYPQSIGMALGFSALIDANFAQARAAIEQQLGKPMSCSTGDGMRACEIKLADKKSAVLMTGQNGQAQTSLVGCYYFYQQ